MAKAEKVVTKLPGAPFCQYTLNRYAPEEADEADDAGERDADHDGGGEAGDNEPPDHRDAHDLHGVRLFAHGA
ncbi:hypothetical protein MABM_23170 [Mycobacteroides abscessus]|nr:hypothetical protein MABM_23170 [Mycobacteroides abscessus]